jgi:hypothetical protein
VAADFAAGPDTIGSDYVLREYPSNDSATNTLTLSWGLSASNYVLQASASLGPDASWNTILTSPALQYGRYMVSVPITNSAGFFRLHAP